MKLPNDKSLCAGRYSLTIKSRICADRETCARYQALVGEQITDRHVVSMILRKHNGERCVHKIEHERD